MSLNEDEERHLERALQLIKDLLDNLKEATGLNFQVLEEEKLPADANMTLMSADIYKLINMLRRACLNHACTRPALEAENHEEGSGVKHFFSPEGDDLEWQRHDLEKIRFVLLRVLNAPDEAVFWFDQWVTYCFDSIETSGVVDDRNYPEMTREVAFEIGAACARADAMDLDYERTGQVNLEPSMQSRLEVAEKLAAKWKE